ncbi:TlpA family protein disulfide reductase [Vibrio salinus]|uniref:TlpA family protein disulfide reductase n=1 Tax=Vibrio salinus TaxID=2899784 RepID=UPI001E33ACF0|nr:hypothetical protein [Vibrio salinus]MCE0492734.1 hypothetical protein [Vibrio salinus]
MGLQIVEPTDVNDRIERKETFVVNVVTAWCPDCTERQSQHIDAFVQHLNEQHIDVFQVNVQMTKGVFISEAHETLTNRFGGHGYPRTVLIKEGVIADKDNVEVITETGLSDLSSKFIKLVQVL